MSVHIQSMNMDVWDTVANGGFNRKLLPTM